MGVKDGTSYVTELITVDKIPYTYLEKRNWNSSEYNTVQGYKLARQDYMSRKQTVLKSGNKQINKFLFREITKTLKEEGHLNSDLQKIKTQFDELIHGSNSVFSEGLKGLNITGHNLAFASDKELKKMATKLKNSGEGLAPLIGNLTKMLDRIQFLGVQDKQLRSKMKNRYGMCGVGEISQLQNSMDKLRALADKKNISEGGQFTYQSGQKQGNIRYNTFLKELRSVFTTFHFHLRGAGNEMIKRGITNAQLTANDFIKNLVAGMSKAAGGTRVHFNQNAVTVKTVGADSFSGRVSKGDTQIIINYAVGKEKGRFVVSISEKSGQIKAESYEAKSMHARLVKEANYETVFNGVDIGSQMYFINQYVHGMRDIKGSDILKYLGARASTNILAGVESEGQAFLFREGDELKTLDEIFNIIQTNTNKMDKYINLQIAKKPSVNNRKRSAKGISIDEAAKNRAMDVYKAFKDGMKFSATFGSKQGF